MDVIVGSHEWFLPPLHSICSRNFLSLSVHVLNCGGNATPGNLPSAFESLLRLDYRRCSDPQGFPSL